MLALTPSIITVLFFTLVQLISAQSHEKKRFSGSLQRRHTTHLAKRFSNARLTYYVAGLGACGHTNKASDFIVALNAAQYGSGGHCGETITIEYGGKSTQATIVDRCPGCPFGGLDCSEGLFTFFASTDAGTISAEWSFGSSEEPKTTSTTPKSTSTPPPPPPTTTKEPATSTTPPMTSTTPKLDSTTSSVSSSSSTATMTPSTSSSVPATSPSPTDGGDTLKALGNTLVQLCEFAEQIIF